MTHDHAVALSLLPSLPRAGLTERLLADDPTLVELAAPLLAQARETPARPRRAAGSTPWRGTIRRFPAHLRTLADMPPALWYRGTLDCVAAPGVAIVGARAASTAALEAARRLGADVAARGVTVISGLARGVDSAAHRGALDARAAPPRCWAATWATCIRRSTPIWLSDDRGRGRGAQRISRRGRPPCRTTFRCATASSAAWRAWSWWWRRRRSRAPSSPRRARSTQGREVMAVPGVRAQRPQPRRARAHPRRGKDCGDCGRYRG